MGLQNWNEFNLKNHGFKHACTNEDINLTGRKSEVGEKRYFNSTLFGFLFNLQKMGIPVNSSSAPATKMPLSVLGMLILTLP